MSFLKSACYYLCRVMTLPEVVLRPTSHKLDVFDSPDDPNLIGLRLRKKPASKPANNVILDGVGDFIEFKKHLKREGSHDFQPHQWPRITTRFRNKWISPKYFSIEEIWYLTGLKYKDFWALVEDLRLAGLEARRLLDISGMVLLYL